MDRRFVQPASVIAAFLVSLMAAVGLFFFPPSQFGGGILVTYHKLAALVLAWAGVAGLLKTPLSYRLSQDTLHLTTLFGRKVIPLSAVSKVVSHGPYLVVRTTARGSFLVWTSMRGYKTLKESLEQSK